VTGSVGGHEGSSRAARRLDAAAPVERNVSVNDRLGDEVSRVVPQLRIDELLDESRIRLAAVRSSRDRVRQLLEAVVGIGSGLDLETALTRIVQAAVTLVDASTARWACSAGSSGSPGSSPWAWPPRRSRRSVRIPRATGCSAS
jgi:hypothetical protein